MSDTEVNYNKYRSRNWECTLFDTELVDKTKFLQTLVNRTDYKYLIYCNEVCPKTQREHIHCMVLFNNPKKLNQLQGFKEKVSWRNVKNIQSLITYIKKDGDWEDFGEEPIGQGHRSDLEELGDMILEGKTFREMYSIYPGSVIRYGKHLKELKNNMYEHRVHFPKIYRSYSIEETTKLIKSIQPETIYYKTDEKFWTDYEQEELVIMPEKFYHVKFSLKCKHSVPIHYGTIPFNSPYIIVEDIKN